MKPQYELYVLRQLAKLLTSEQQQLRLLKALRLACYVIAWFSIVALAFFANRGNLNALHGVVLGTFAGMVAGMGFYFSSALRQWPVVRQHMNKETVLSRLKELET